MRYKLRFKTDEENTIVRVYARSKSDGTWHQIGICNPAAIKEIKAGKLELINFNQGIPKSKAIIAAV